MKTFLLHTGEWLKDNLFWIIVAFIIVGFLVLIVVDIEGNSIRSRESFVTNCQAIAELTKEQCLALRALVNGS